MLIKVGKERGVRQVLQAGGVVPHVVEGPRQVRDSVAIPVGTLVEAGLTAQVRGCSVGGHGPFAEPALGRGVVRAGVDGDVLQGVVLAQDVELPQHPFLLEVAVGDGAVGVVLGDQGRLDVRRERLPPHVALAVGREVHPAHPMARRVGGPNVGGGLGHDLGEVRGT